MPNYLDKTWGLPAFGSSTRNLSLLNIPKKSHEAQQKVDRSRADTETSSDSISQEKTIHKHISQQNTSKRIKSCQISEIIRFSQQIEEEQFFVLNSDECLQKAVSPFQQKFNTLLNLYISEEIIKHYCLKSQWQFESHLVQTHVMPTLDLLAVKREDLKYKFQPFLQKITERYLLHTDLDTFSRLSSSALLIEITYVWLKIKQAQINLRRQIRNNIHEFERQFCRPNCNTLEIDKQKLYSILFSNSQDLKMINIIKIHIFLFRVQGQNNSRSLLTWLEQY